ncbi:MAG: Wzz/FepE/Etk N-terminal domain-containing protein [Eubacteriales bacterium]|nr:Wzz/FepE/Etk N-terminal domain-containing protein [Eubacteriales bacterium]
MNLDANVQKIITLLLKKWKTIILFALIGTFVAYFFTANFTTLTYASSVEFLATAVDKNQELSDSTSSSAVQQASNTSKMNYAMKMMATYIEIFKTNEFNQKVANELNENLSTNYSASTIKNAITIESISDTALFKMTVTTTDADLSYQIAHQLEETVPDVMETKNSGLVTATVEDTALKATSAQSLGYAKKCLVGFAVGFVFAAAFYILKDLLDVRIKSSEELTERYDIPVLGTIPEFEFKSASQIKRLEKAEREGKK